MTNLIQSIKEVKPHQVTKDQTVKFDLSLFKAGNSVWMHQDYTIIKSELTPDLTTLQCIISSNNNGGRCWVGYWDPKTGQSNDVGLLWDMQIAGALMINDKPAFYGDVFHFSGGHQQTLSPLLVKQMLEGPEMFKSSVVKIVPLLRTEQPLSQPTPPKDHSTLNPFIDLFVQNRHNLMDWMIYHYYNEVKERIDKVEAEAKTKATS